MHLKAVIPFRNEDYLIAHFATFRMPGDESSDYGILFCKWDVFKFHYQMFSFLKNNNLLQYIILLFGQTETKFRILIESGQGMPKKLPYCCQQIGKFMLASFKKP